MPGESKGTFPCAGMRECSRVGVIGVIIAYRGRGGGCVQRQVPLRDAREGKFPVAELKDRGDELHALAVKLRKETGKGYAEILLM